MRWRKWKKHGGDKDAAMKRINKRKEITQEVSTNELKKMWNRVM